MEQSDKKIMKELDRIGIDGSILKEIIQAKNKLQDDMMTYHNIDAKKVLAEMLREHIQVEKNKEEKLNQPSSMEERIENMKEMLEHKLPSVVREQVLKNLISILEKKIRINHCE